MTNNRLTPIATGYSDCCCHRLLRKKWSLQSILQQQQQGVCCAVCKRIQRMGCNATVIIMASLSSTCHHSSNNNNNSWVIAYNDSSGLAFSSSSFFFVNGRHLGRWESEICLATDENKDKVRNISDDEPNQQDALRVKSRRRGGNWIFDILSLTWQRLLRSAASVVMPRLLNVSMSLHQLHKDEAEDEGTSSSVCSQLFECWTLKHALFCAAAVVADEDYWDYFASYFVELADWDWMQDWAYLSAAEHLE